LSVSLDLIYGTPGESLIDWRTSVEAALACVPDHVSAYALVVEEGTKLAARVRRGEVARPDDDDLADKYEMADELFSGAGLHWYEVSNWAKDAASACQHNLAYWRGDDWWGVGPGAHSHVGGVRWWNVRHPRAYAERIDAGISPAAGREVLDEEQRAAEAILLGVRLARGLPLDDATLRINQAQVARLIADGLVDGVAALGRGRSGGASSGQAGLTMAGSSMAGSNTERPRLVLTHRGRLLADAVVRALLS